MFLSSAKQHPTLKLSSNTGNVVVLRALALVFAEGPITKLYWGESWVTTGPPTFPRVENAQSFNHLNALLLIMSLFRN
jgi:hypothetical protein